MTAKMAASKAAANGADREQEDPKWLKGVAISMWQNSGDDMLSNWSHFIASRRRFMSLPIGPKRFEGQWGVNERSPNTWDRYQEDIDLAVTLGCTAFRLSVEWARIEPRRGHIDMQAVERYNAIFDAMAKAGIEPNATLHHWTHPQWFEEMGGFEVESNIPLFAEWAAKAVELFGSRVRFWATFNEPTCYMVAGWIDGVHSPGKKLNVMLAGKVFSNILKAHVAAYRAIKATPAGQRASVGLVHLHNTFQASGPKGINFAAKYLVRWLNHWWGYDLLHQWMLTGRFTWDVPLLGRRIDWQLPEGRPPCDWFGVNYYSRTFISWDLKPGGLPGEIKTDFGWPLYAEGLYTSLMQAKEYGIPLYITETGIADRADKHRSFMIDSYFKAALRAIRDGADVQGLYLWTLVDNFEWRKGYEMNFGLYAWRPDGSVDRQLREGSKMLVRYFKSLPDTVEGVRTAVARVGNDMETPEQLSEASAGSKTAQQVGGSGAAAVAVALMSAPKGGPSAAVRGKPQLAVMA